MSFERHRDRIVRLLRERMETNTVGSLDAFLDEATERFGLDRSAPAREGLRALVEAAYEEYQRTNTFDYDDIVEQSFPASDPPPHPGS